jgi:outer membrane protein assembly factor BamB
MRLKLLVASVLFASALARGADWLTEGGDAGRTGWQRHETILNPQNVSGMKLLWKTKFDSTTRQMHNLFPPLLVNNVNTDAGKKEIAVVAGISDDLWGVDAVTGKEIWHRKFDSTYDPSAATGRGGQGGTLCPGGQLAVPTVELDGEGRYRIYAVSWDGRLRQVNVADGKDLAEPEKFLPPNTKPYALNVFKNVVYTSISQGCGGVPFAIFSFDLATRKTSTFLPRGGGLWGRRGVAVGDDGTVYMGTGDQVFMMKEKDLGNAIVAVKVDGNQQLQYAGFFAPKNANWMWKRDLDVNVSPVAFDYKGKHLLIGTSKECRLWLLDRDHFGGDDNRTPIDRSGLICNDGADYDAKGVWGAPATYQDAAGVQWVYVPFWGPVSKSFHAPVEDGRPVRGGVAAFKIEEKNGKLTFVPAWLSRDMDMAEEAIIANGVVYTYGSGENTDQQRPELAWDEKPRVAAPEPGPGNGGSATRIALSTRATLYALDAKTGKTLWSSGDQITSWNHSAGISVANGKVYIPTFDGYLYCFGLEGKN